VIAALVIFPAFVLLFVLDQRGLLPGEGASEHDADTQATSA
jgi:hypothetical protein